MRGNTLGSATESEGVRAVADILAKNSSITHLEYGASELLAVTSTHPSHGSLLPR